MRSLIDRLFDVHPSDYDEMRDYLNDNDFSECADCDSWEHNDSLRQPTAAMMRCAATCINNCYTWSNYCDNHVHRDYSARAIDQYGDEVTIHENDSDFHYDDNSGQYRHDEYGIVPVDRVLSQHQAAWLRVRASPTGSSAMIGFIGVELEIEMSL